MSKRDVVDEPADTVVEIPPSLCARRGDAAQMPARVRAEDCSAHPASQNANLVPLIEWPAISLPARHAKVRREGYRR